MIFQVFRRNGQNVLNPTLPVDQTTRVTVDYTTSSGSATAGVDFQTRSGELVLGRGENVAPVSVPIVPDALDEANEQIHFKVRKVVNVVGPLTDLADRRNYPAGLEPTASTAADFNNDGRIDWVAATSQQASLRLYLNITSPGEAVATFASQGLVLSDRPRAVASADFNADGKIDLVASQPGSDTLVFLRNTTAPGSSTLSFQPFTAASVSTGDGPVALVVDDFDNDDRPDVAVANSIGRTISVFLNRIPPGSAGATFAPRQDFAAGHTANESGLIAADFNRNGWIDLAVGDTSSMAVSVLVNATTPGGGIASFLPQQDVFLGSMPSGLVAGDFNGDGITDVAAATGSAAVRILLNQTPLGALSASFLSPPSVSVAGLDGGLHALAAVDANADGKLDLLCSGTTVNSVVALVSNLKLGWLPTAGDPTPAFEATSPRMVESARAQLTLVDFNNNGFADVVAVGPLSASATVLMNATRSGAEGFMPAFSPIVLPVGLLPDQVAVADMNLDGKVDLISPDQNSLGVSVLVNTTPPGSSAPSFLAAQSFPTETTPNYVVTADFNGDGRTDMAVTNALSNSVSVLLNDTASDTTQLAFTGPLHLLVPAEPISAVAEDVNGDGSVDLVVAGTTGNRLAVLLNTTAKGASTPSFAAIQNFNAPAGAAWIKSLDLNGDGRIDFAVACEDSNAIAFFMNETALGTGVVQFASVPSILTSGSPRDLNAADMNGDGLKDLVVCNYGSNGEGTTISVFRNVSSIGSPTPSFSPPEDFGGYDAPFSVDLSDLNLDGRPDLSVASLGLDRDDPTPGRAGSVMVRLNQTISGGSALNFGEALSLLEDTNPIGIVAADFNFDARPDLLASNFFDNTVTVLSNSPIALRREVPVGSIIDDDLPPNVTFLRANQALAEGSAVDLQVSLNTPSGLDIAASFTIGGTAGVLQDFTFAPSVLFIPAGEVAASLHIELLENGGAQEFDETVILTLEPNSRVTLGTIPQFTLTIVDNEVPAFVSGVFRNATAPQAVELEFSKDVGASLTVGDLILTNLNSGGVVATGGVQLSYDAGTRVATFVLAGGFPGSTTPGALPDGNYRARIPAAAVNDSQGNPMPQDLTFDFFMLRGDANGDRTVNIDDFGVIGANFNRSPRNFTQGDFNYTGTVDIDDFALLASRFNQSLPANDPPRLTAGVGAATPAMPKRRAGFDGVFSAIRLISGDEPDFPAAQTSTTAYLP